MTPATRHALGLVPLPDEQAARIEAQPEYAEVRWGVAGQALLHIALIPDPAASASGRTRWR